MCIFCPLDRFQIVRSAQQIVKSVQQIVHLHLSLLVEINESVQQSV